ncbi:MAG: hypothetical protein B6D41_00780 [Chloroflexi bacterium UTCFX4]|jgi:serine/threonine protein kinase|nr:MAG: hypothetical protein B6D41_00780 [Chloroflexi bacterium UTCFX4]
MQICEHCHYSNREHVCFCARCGAPTKWDVNTGQLKPGIVLDQRYPIVRLISVGGMGAVYLALDQRLGNQEVVIKEMLDKKNPQERQQAIEWFEREASLLSRLQSNHIPRVSNHFSECNRHYLVMDFVKGTNLEQVLNQQQRQALQEEMVLNWALQLCDVLIYLHEYQPAVIFRDLKPANVMLQPDGQLKLIDFGIARHFQATQPGTILGTPGYAPLEQYQGLAEPRSDVYALGATLHELMTGRAPIPFNFPPIRTLNPRASVQMESAIAAAVGHLVQDRPSSVREFKELLETVNAKFSIAVDWAHPILDKDSNPLGQFRVKIRSADTIVQQPVQTHFCLLLDVSGSMRLNRDSVDVSQQKYWPLLQATEHLVTTLPDSDLLSIIVFAQASDQILAAELVQEIKHQPIGGAGGLIDRSRISQSPGSATNLAQALQTTWQLTQQMQRPNIVHRVLLLTDGQIHDLASCGPLFEQIEKSPLEVYAYGFGVDWHDEPLRSMLTNVRGGSFKPVSTSPTTSTFDIRNTFSRFAQTSQNIIATNPRLQVTFSPQVKPGDVFRYSPIARLLGNAVNSNNVFDTAFEAMEAGKEYSWCFEVRLQPAAPTTQTVGRITLTYEHQGRALKQQQTILVERSADAALTRRMDPEVDEVFTFLEFLRSDSPQKQLQSLMARRDIAVRKGYDEEHINALTNAIEVLQRGGRLEELPLKDQLWVRTDPRGITRATFH